MFARSLGEEDRLRSSGRRGKKTESIGKQFARRRRKGGNNRRGGRRVKREKKERGEQSDLFDEEEEEEEVENECKLGKERERAR